MITTAVAMKVNSEAIIFYTFLVLEFKLRDVGTSTFSGRHLLVVLRLAVYLKRKTVIFCLFFTSYKCK